MRCEYLQLSTGLRDAMQLGYEPNHVRYVFDHMPADYLFKLVVGKGKRKDAEIVNDIGMTAWVGVDADRAGEFILATTYVQNSLGGFGHALSFSATAIRRTGPG